MRAVCGSDASCTIPCSLRVTRHVLKLHLPTLVYILAQKKLVCERGVQGVMCILKIDEHVVKCRYREKDGTDKTSRWRLTFPTLLGMPLDLNCTASHD